MKTIIGLIGALCISSSLLAAEDAEKNQLTEQDLNDGSAGLIKHRMGEELKAYNNTFSLIPHKINYILPLTYQNDPNEAPFSQSNRNLMNTEVKFQVSFKVPVTKETLFEDNGYLFFGYTSKSVWQAYNTDESSPFRDTNHEPEIMLMFTTDTEWLGAKVPLVTFGFSHQSNGQQDGLSRSWNRLYMDVLMEYEKFYISFKPWYRIPERAKRDVFDAKGDDNPDIDDYFGYFELRAFRKINDNELSIMLRNNLRSDNRGAIEMNYSYPFNKKVRGYVQLFHGYGETLLDYNHKNTRLGIGFMLNNWL
ncbi:phospholipase A [Pleionea mediterranea]|uniref:Phospholipase A1 n=1 Tax=Pleionea mediterranea TaxID=523701 RepID=A0A316FXY4_9GAMM|nr:phospholipase A [Pleionea mediterranea]PWK53624.1 phospholipase A1 [Pleionea mediterranea]